MLILPYKMHIEIEDLIYIYIYIYINFQNHQNLQNLRSLQNSWEYASISWKYTSTPCECTPTTWEYAPTSWEYAHIYIYMHVYISGGSREVIVFIIIDDGWTCTIIIK